MQSSDWRAYADGCALAAGGLQAREVAIAKVFDGDTVALTDGRRVRLLGVNAPEKARDNEPAQFYGHEATELARALVRAETGWRLLLSRQRKDRYGRTLGYLLDRRGVSLGSQLVARGAAFYLVKSPDRSHGVCFAELEARARSAGLGLWTRPDRFSLRAERASRKSLGFSLVHGAVTKVDYGKTVFIELDDRVAVRFRDVASIPAGRWQALLGRQVEVRGWMVKRRLSKKQKAQNFKGFFIDGLNESALMVDP